ncbi:MAG TPA: amidohydrolase [Marmoricola sp.]|nr:amidohydrolase [Marmoricola sp.]
MTRSTLYRHPRIFTGTAPDAFAEAFLVEDGRVTWVGAARDAPETDRTENLEGGLVLPGLIDTHTHPTWIARIVDAVACGAPAVTSIDELVEALRGHQKLGIDGEWVDGWGYDEAQLAERRTPTRDDLDRVSTTQPVHVLRSDAHSGVCNTRALEIAGITRDTPDPPGASFGRHPDGTPNGVLTEVAANHAVMRHMRSPGFEADVDALVRVSTHLAERGIVAVTDMACVPGSYEQLDLYREAARRGFKQNVRVFYVFDALRDRPVKAPTGEQGQVAVGGVKLFLDGSVSNRTAWMRTPFRGSATEHGFRTASPEEVAAAAAYSREHRIQLAVHAMGDRALQEVVDVLGEEEPWLDTVPSVRVEHATVLDADLVARMAGARMAFGVATNVDFLFAEHGSYAANLTGEQLARCYPVRTLYDGLGPAALSSDCPATTWPDPDDPFMSIQAAVTRRAHDGSEMNAVQAVTVGEALMLYTGRARLVTDLGDVGRIVPGAEASFVTVDRDLFEVGPSTIIDSAVTGTWIRGEQVYERARP